MHGSALHPEAEIASLALGEMVNRWHIRWHRRARTSEKAPAPRGDRSLAAPDWLAHARCGDRNAIGIRSAISPMRRLMHGCGDGVVSSRTAEGSIDQLKKNFSVRLMVDMIGSPGGYLPRNSIQASSQPGFLHGTSRGQPALAFLDRNGFSCSLLTEGHGEAPLGDGRGFSCPARGGTVAAEIPPAGSARFPGSADSASDTA